MPVEKTSSACAARRRRCLAISPCRYRRVYPQIRLPVGMHDSLQSYKRCARAKSTGAPSITSITSIAAQDYLRSVVATAKRLAGHPGWLWQPWVALGGHGEPVLPVLMPMVSVTNRVCCYCRPWQHNCAEISPYFLILPPLSWGSPLPSERHTGQTFVCRTHHPHWR